MKYVFLFSSLF